MFSTQAFLLALLIFNLLLCFFLHPEMQIIKTILAIILHVKDLAVKESFLQCITKARVADPDLSFKIGRGSDLIKCIIFKIIEIVECFVSLLYFLKSIEKNPSLWREFWLNQIC